MRLKNAVIEGDPMPGGDAWPVIGTREVIEAIGTHPAWQRRAEKGPGEGVGMAFGGWPGGTQPASALCRLNSDGSVSVVIGSVDISGTKTGMALLAADAFGADAEGIEIVAADSDTAPFAGASGGSKITYTVGAAVVRAAAEARRQVLEIAADMLEAAPQDLDIVNGSVQVKGVPDRGISLKKIAQVSTGFGQKYEPVLGQGRVGQPDSAPGFVAHLARVHVDTDTGVVKVLDYVAAQDVGKVINPAGIEGQVRGGVAQGIGWALFEQMIYDDSGHLRTGSFADYELPSALEVPHIDNIMIECPSPDGPLGARGVGEPPVVPCAAAIANAVYDAIGVRPTELPIRPESILRLLNGQSGTA
jgi:CO/xanthine dehydrogenase Mo-binding subunit